MPCYHPIRAYKIITDEGKVQIKFSPKTGYKDLPISLPCGQCVGCRLERARQWAVRCVHEASLWDRNCFVTLTYDDDHMPAARSLQYRDFQLFKKRLKKLFPTTKLDENGHALDGVRFYMCGEYGENFGRPHYHALLFNCDFDDKVLLRREGSVTLFRSPTLERLWTYGYSSVGAVTFESAAYVARYVMKKITGEAAGDHYACFDEETGVCERTPEFNRMSLKPGIGARWIAKYQGEVYPEDEVILKGRRQKPPRYYDRLYEAQFPSDMEKVKRARLRRAKQFKGDCTPERLRVREEVATAKLRQKKRGLK